MVQAFGQEKIEIRNYSRHLARAKAVGIRTHFKTAMVLGSLNIANFGYYAYGFYTGSWLIT